MHVLVGDQSPLNGGLLRAMMLAKLLKGTVQVTYWDWFSVNTNNKGLALRVLPPFRQIKSGVFGAGGGFVSMELKGREFKFSFTKDGRFGVTYGKEYLKRATAECSLLAKKFC